MRIEGVAAAPFSLRLRRRFRAGGVDVSHREGHVVRLTSNSGLVGYGEIAPLPGLHRESLAEAEQALRIAGAALPGCRFDDFEGLAECVGGLLGSLALPEASACPSTCFGLQAAAAGLFAQAGDTTPAHLWSEAPRPYVPLNALFTGSPEDAERTVATGTWHAFPALKVKIGGRTEAEDRAVLRTLCAALPETTRLRIDGNRSLTPRGALARLRGVARERIEYLEEPLADPTRLADLNARTGIPIALDETLREEPTLANASHVAAWILKPSVIGDWRKIRSQALDAAGQDKAVVISSALESGLGLWFLAQLAAALPGADVPAGLATDAWLEDDLVSPPYDSRAGEVETAGWTGTPAADVLTRLCFEAVS